LTANVAAVIPFIPNHLRVLSYVQENPGNPAQQTHIIPSPGVGQSYCQSYQPLPSYNLISDCFETPVRLVFSAGASASSLNITYNYAGTIFYFVLLIFS